MVKLSPARRQYQTTWMQNYRKAHSEFRHHEVEYTRQYRKLHPEGSRAMIERRRLRRQNQMDMSPMLTTYDIFYVNPEKRRQYMKTYYSKNRKKIFRAALMWKKKNPERYLLHERNYHHKRRELLENKGKINIDEWMRIVSASPMCSACGRFVECENLAMDHVVPISRGGYHVLANLSPLCKSCNSRKRAKMPPLHVIKEIISKGGADPKILEEILCQQMTTTN
jgi:5-methylcytosine-specific restriction endonuclease McrA